MNAEIFALYHKSLLLKNNINIENVNTEEYSAITAHIRNKANITEWYKGYVESLELESIFENPVEQEEQIPSQEEQAEHNKKMLAFLPKEAKEAISA